MKSKWIGGSIFLLAFSLACPGYAQFTAEELAQRPFWEEFLKTAAIVRAEEIGEGVTKPLRLYLAKSGKEASGAWKNPRGIKQGFLEGWQYEIAAYELDKLTGLNMVPPAVEREYNGKPGALSFWVTSEYSLLKIMDQKIEIPEAFLKQTDDMKYLARAWDSLIANDDRTQQNILFTKDWRTILIDHSRAFRSTKEYTDKLMFGKNGLKKSADGRPFLFRRLPRAFVEAVKKLTFESIKSAVAPYLTDKEIEAILKRKTLLLAEIDEMIKESGEARVLY